MSLLRAFWNSLLHPTKYRWISLETDDGSILVGTVTEEIWQSFKEQL